MRRRSLLTKTLNRIAAAAAAVAVFNPFELAQSVGSFYSNRAVQPPDSPVGEPSALVARRTVDDRYVMTYEWSGRLSRYWRLRFAVERQAYQAATRRSLGYVGAFDAARRNRHARRFAAELEDAERTRPDGSTRGLDPETERFDRAVGLVRSLAYLADPDSRNVPEYHRMIEETLVDGCGDCKDATYLLAGVLSQAPFGYQTAMVFVPEHMLLGVHRSDLPAAYTDAPTLPGCEYTAVESIYSDPVGTLSEEPVLAVYDGEFEYLDRSAIVETTGAFVRDPSEFSVVANAHW